MLPTTNIDIVLLAIAWHLGEHVIRMRYFTAEHSEISLLSTEGICGLCEFDVYV